MSIKPAGTPQGRIQDVRPVRCSEDNDGIRSTESIHFNKQRIEGLPSLILTTGCSPNGTTATNGIDLIDKNYAGCICFGLFENISYPEPLKL